MAASTRESIERAARELHYRPNAVARSLRTRRSHTAGLIIPDISNPFYPRLARGLQDELAAVGCHVLVCNTDRRPGNELEYLVDVLDRQVDGVVIVAFHLSTADLAQVPLGDIPARLDRPAARPSVDRRGYDRRRRGRARCDPSPARLGHSVGLIGGPAGLPPSESRAGGYREALADSGTPFRPELVADGDFTRAGGATAMRELAARPDRPTAIFCANDLMAIGAMDVARELGLDVPGDIALVGYDDIEAASLVTPSLTTVLNPADQVGADGRAPAARAHGRVRRAPPSDRDPARIRPARFRLKEQTHPMHDVLDPRDLLEGELDQCRESGRDISSIQEAAVAALADGSAAERRRLLRALADGARGRRLALRRAVVAGGDHGDAPPCRSRLAPSALAADALGDRLHAAWLGRVAGCILGKPVEGWDRADIRTYLEARDAYPLTAWFPAPQSPEEAEAMRPCWTETTAGNIEFASRDDDIDFTILGVHILEEHGFDFGPEHVAAEWLDHFPFTQIYTAERAAYRNLLHGLQPPQTAIHDNPYREWIGAQIRADVWGYVSPGRPDRAAALAFQDASLSHTANGIYGAMWAAALIAASFTATDLPAALDASLAFVPPRSRLAEALRHVIALHASGAGWETARDEIEQAYGHYGFVHTINNAAVVAAALLWGEEDFTKVIGLAVQGGWDTDCNGATAGSAFGARYGTGGDPRALDHAARQSPPKRALRLRQLQDLRSRRAHRRALRGQPGDRVVGDDRADER